MGIARGSGDALYIGAHHGESLCFGDTVDGEASQLLHD